jgi:ribosomal protein L40E
MTKKSLGYVQLEWTCPNCNVKNPGMQKLCSGCGAAQPADVQFEQAAQEVMIEDEATLEKAKAGPDFHCAYCGARNPAGSETCHRCGGDLTQAKARESGRVLGAHRDKPVAPVSCPSCGSPNDPNEQRCVQCGSTMAQREEAPEKPAAPPAKKKFPVALVAVLVLFCIVAAVVVVLMMRTEDTVGRVESVEWTRGIGVEALQPVEHEDWLDQIPADAELGACTEKVHHTQEEPAANSVEVCGTPYTVDTGSGAGEVVQDCEYEVYAEWCDYYVDEWVEIEVVEISGTDLNPQWPAFELAAGEQEGEYRESYEVLFSADGDTYTYSPDTETEFLQFETGTDWVLAVNTFGGVVSVSKE